MNVCIFCAFIVFECVSNLLLKQVYLQKIKLTSDFLNCLTLKATNINEKLLNFGSSLKKIKNKIK